MSISRKLDIKVESLFIDDMDIKVLLSTTVSIKFFGLFLNSKAVIDRKPIGVKN